MHEKDVVQMLQFYRHDLMNYVQLIQGYVSMERMEKVETNVANLMRYLNEERKLINLNAPLFVLWMIQFNHVHVSVRLTYSINIENKDLHSTDKFLVEQCEHIIKCIKISKSNTELYEGELKLNETSDLSIIEASLSVDGCFSNMDKFNKSFASIEQKFLVNIEKSTTGIMCTFLVPCN